MNTISTWRKRESLAISMRIIYKIEEVSLLIEVNKIYNGDCITGLQSLVPDNSIDLVVTDPPYKLTGGGKGDGANSKRPKGILVNNASKLFDVPRFEDWLPEVYRVLKPSGHCYVFINFKNLQELLNVSSECGFKHSNLLVWRKNNCTPSQYYMKNCEYVLLMYKGKAKYINNIGDSKTTHDYDNIIGGKLHPTEKPLGLIKFYINNSSNPGNIVLDPFMGSGTTAVAAMALNRSFIGFEISQEYCDIANQRLKNMANNQEGVQ